MRAPRQTPTQTARTGQRRALRLLAVACAGLILLWAATANAYVRPHLRTTLTKARGEATTWLGSEPLGEAVDLRGLYLERQFQPLWVSDHGFTPGFHLGLEALLSAPRHGLDSAEYHAERLRELVEQVGERTRSRDLAEAELLLSDGLILYGKHLSGGRIDPSSLHPAWTPKDVEVDVAAALLAFAAYGDAGEFERRLAPRQEVYWRTLEAARRWRMRTGGERWPPFPVDRTLRPGDLDPAVVLLRRRLQASGELSTGEPPDPRRFDPPLEEAVKQFQARHGLEADGVVGSATRSELQVTAGERHRQLLLTLERLRWLPRRWQGRTLVVNAADFVLAVWQDGERVLDMRVIVGRPGQKTPVFHQRLERVEINPYWKVPQSIAVQELLPKIREDCGYLEQNGFELVSSYSDAASVLDPAGVDWESVGWGNFPGRIRQCPGPENALGRLKFLFPNLMDVYLHDTPRRRLFSRSQRSLSHGCVRVEQPITLADYVLQDHPEWSAERLDQVIASGERHVVALETPSEVYLLYWTAWADADGTLQFRHDVYHRDSALLTLLAGASDSPRTASLNVPPARPTRGPIGP